MQTLPDIGLGTFQNTYRDECVESVVTALDEGYRHIDTAQVYDTEPFVGEAIESSSVDREDIFVATKIWNENLGYDDVLDSFDESLDRLGLEEVDLLYAHWPAGAYDAEETLSAFDELYDAGKIRNVGVSNFTKPLLDEAIDQLDAPLYANQIEVHPLCQQRELVEYCKSNDIEVVAYSPLARGRVIDIPELRDIGETRECTAAQVSLAWLREQDITPIPMAQTKRFIKENYESLEVKLTDEDHQTIATLDEGRRTIDPEYAPW
ncbi:aldo/keto reductase [Natranaeroarchaeum sulfidigenes]|uniref:Aldo/keto reductase, related to diketogulonate reductase n=1 Tax=Natranaeroarchaeum sulfidigenes TaxID=2784880 RepID=A0A897MZ36_9EURY|nr:aldo/keto reductase [Natranaeroarchaeum sulfidigenes]QSG03386.1 Aldo/keto reductase, related to diketogulonate reductase [Natranaeroarchaeum sulfidigenes]